MPHADEIRHVYSRDPSRPLYWIGRFLCFAFFRLAHGFRCWGQHNIPLLGPVIIASNHVSFYDPVLIGLGSPRAVRFMAMLYYFRFPLLGALMRGLGAFSVDLGHPDREALAEGMKVLDRGEVLGIFPEGHRSADGRLDPLRGGVAMMALRKGARIVPASISGAFEAWPKHRRLPRPGKITVRYHPPIDPRPIFARCEGDKRAARRELLNQLTAAIDKGIVSRPT